ncbi:hypothetical protein K502DRAFT_308819 [Neoconidiobolus thromboides FSU 785]|nr:hypothetical protein K502DRAFT_308819 [Neoconidiobolus thromboides FSU 785]
MSKRSAAAEHHEELRNDSDDMGEMSESEINVEFDFFDPKEIDFHNIKNFMTNYFGKDRIDTSDLADLIISQPLIGTTIKAVEEDDALAIFTILNMNVHESKNSITQIRDYILSSSRNNQPLYNLLQALLAPGSTRHLGLLLNERLINMPVQIAPPMYKMLGEEIEWAIQDKEPYNFEYILLLSKTYKEVESQETGEGGKDDQDRKKRRNQPSAGAFYINLEDEIVSKFAEFEQVLEYHNSAVPDSKRAFSEFGVLPGRKFFLFHSSKYHQILQALTEAIPTPQ